VCLANRRHCPDDLVRLGSDYGGWWIPERSLGPGVIAYCIGAGEDITFDLELWARGCTVRTCDPTPRAIDFVAREGPDDPRFTFAPFALWTEDRVLRFYEPKDSSHVSYSAVNIQRTDGFIEVEARSLESLLRHFEDDRCDVLKLDIEGAEMDVLPSISRAVSPPNVLCVEFDRPRPLRSLLMILRELRRMGYRPVKSERLNVLFLKDVVG
jgi:FkbM family methyltransferase